MKNQRMKTEVRSFRFLSVAIVLLMLATLICCFTVMTSAAGTQLSIDREDLDLSGLQTDGSQLYFKNYDGTTSANVRLKANADIGIAAGDDVTVVVSAAFNSKNVADAKYIEVSFDLDGADAGKYTEPASLRIDATIRPAVLQWAENGKATTNYKPGATTYEDIEVQIPALDTTKIVSGEQVSASTTPVKVTLGGVNGVGEYVASTKVDLTGADAVNYVAAQLSVDVTVEKLEIVDVRWNSEYVFDWGEKEAYEIEVFGFDAEDNRYTLKVVYPVGYGAAGTHTIRVELPDAANMKWAAVSTATTQKQVLINKLTFVVDMPDVTYVGSEGTQNPEDLFMIAVEGEMPASIREKIEYICEGAPFVGAWEYGSYVITAKLPSDGGNYEFVDASGAVIADGTLSAVLTINKKFVAAAGQDAPYQMILIGNNGFAGNVTASVAVPEQIAKKAIRGFAVHKAYTLKVTGAGDETFTVLIPIETALYHKNCSALTANDLYVYDGAEGTMVKANTKAGYTVTIADGYYTVEGVSGSAEITFVIAPVYNTPFALSPIGITLWVLLVLALIAILILVGMYIRRVRQAEGESVLIIDTEGDAPEVTPVEVEDKVDEDAYLEDAADKAAENADGTVEEEEPDTEGVEDAVAEAMSELTDTEETEEVAEETEEGDIAEDLADKMADDLADSVDAETEAEAEADEDALREAVDEAMSENFNDSADASDAVVIIAEEESDELTFEDFKAVVDAIVSDAMCRTMVLPEELFAEEEETEEVVDETTEEVVDETVEEVVDETTEEVVDETTEEVVDETTEEVVDETTEEVVDETAEEVVDETAEEATDETVDEVVEVDGEVVVEEMSGEDICAVVADSVAEAFELVAVDGVVPPAVDGLTAEMISDAVKDAADENVPETWTEEMAAAVTEAVSDELAARLLVEEPAVETLAVVEESVSDDDDDDDDDNDSDNDEDDSFFGFGSMPLDFIDAVAEAERYAEMLEQERNGEVRLVTRYRRSFTSRMIQSQGNVQDYYTVIKNALLSHKGVKNRISWNYEAFNRGRTHLAKINAKTKTLYLYLALDPEELKDTKYGIVDVSSKKKYATVPVLMKIKGERKFKYALELIAKLCEEDMGLPKLEIEEVDYRMPYQPTEELVESGVVKKLVAAVPVSAYGAESTEEAPVESASATAEAQEVTFVEPTTAPAVEAAAEELPAEEAPVEETPAEETPADAPASTDEPTEV